ncbi:hypothetical protein SUGI_0226180 [Cryptomeria japonica]|uniref:mannosyl-oligosaccharide glucosidase GCS1 n=1 Tax=Cryptomeria japonica TaxID=3369 RepID=UPI002408DFFF|nr:mannosyl-oligosaccharide glucosidase GCS1 [Cryptomeria japonica]GLJ14104.1 hypothetical protein SUGI_0226180 [Cryptomeria japonica]
MRSRNKGSAIVKGSDDHVRQKIISNKHRRKGLFSGVEVKWKALLITAMFALLTIFLLIYYYMENEEMDGSSSLSIITPLPVPKITDLPQFGGEHRESLYWGTYRPQVYLGIRARTPKSLIAGLMWLAVKDSQYVLRHTCEMSDELKIYGWLRHDGRNYGHQVIVDQDMAMTTTFLKSRGNGSGYGGDWAIRLDVRNDRYPNENSLKNVHLFFYIADEGGNIVKLGKSGSTSGINIPLVSGHHEDVGGWELHGEGMDNMEVHYAGFKTPHMHNLTDLVRKTLAKQTQMVGRLQLPDTSEESSNFMIFQISSKIPFEMDLVFVSGTDAQNQQVQERLESLSGVQLTERIREQEDIYEDHFQKRFNLSGKVDEEAMVVGRAAVSNLIGGIGYFFGRSQISVPKESRDIFGSNIALYWPAALYTAVPSRSFFPRGFLWDEGFHQLLICRWDIQICLDIMGHWLDLMNSDGWIPREQILGAEALSKVPEEFIPQHTTNANPPTLFLVLRDLAFGLTKDTFTNLEKENIMAFLERAWPRLDVWFHWFNTTQTGKYPSSYFWHGRDNATDRELNPKTLSSGFDDYPRASHPSEDERHVDLRCWMSLAAECMHLISRLLGLTSNKYHPTAKQLSDLNLLNDMHYDNVSGTYHDFGNHTEQVSLKWIEILDEKNLYIRRELRRVVSRRPRLRLVPHFGYVSLFPFIMKLIPSDSPILTKQMDLIHDKSLLWTGYGLRSLATTSSLYMKRNTEHDPPYWRGPVWINTNYLILSALHHYAQESGPYKTRAAEVYTELRQNLIENIVFHYFRSGYFWEQYDNTAAGKGKGAHPFTGWTSLIALIMAEIY